MVSSVLYNGPYINTPLSRCRETWAGGMAGAGGGGVAGNPWLVLDLKEFYAGACVMGVFDGDCSLGGGG
jgi:hypothetical protein